jgi:hypothetical protein
MPGDIAGCITQVRLTGTKSYGSGYLIAPDLVLTACHVVTKSQTDPPPADLGVEIRTIDHFHHNVDFQKATLVWPPRDRWPDLARYDVALLEITPDAVTRAAARPIKLGVDGLAQDQLTRVQFVGFPRLMKVDNVRDAKQVFGEVELLSGLLKDLVQITINGRQPTEDEEWKGASGAAVLADGQIIGVLTVKIEQGGLVDFHASRLRIPLADPEFSRRVNASRLHAASTPPVSDFDLNRLVCLVDRDPQDTAFRSVFRSHLDGQPTQPLCCIIYGEAQHRPTELLARFAAVTIPEMRKLRGEALRFWPISWPSGNVDAVTGLTLLRKLLWNHLSDEDGSEPPEDCNQFRERLCDESRPHLFSTELTAAHLTAENAALWSQWLSFLDTISACKLTRPPLHVFLLTDVSRDAIEGWLRQVPPAKETKQRALDELQSCVWGDFDLWISQRVPKFAPSLAGQVTKLRGDLEFELETLIGGNPGPFTISNLKNAVRALARRGN